MDARQTSARFAAYVWYTEVCADSCATPGKARRAAARFARKHWRSFLPWANQGLGKLLRRIARPRCQPAV